jgi:uncharacterized protein DUF2510
MIATVAPLASTALDIARLVGYVIVPVIIGGIILIIARRQDRSKDPAAGTASMHANPFATASASAQTPAPAQTAPPDWYDDPWRQARLRYWDGTAWTGHTAP